MADHNQSRANVPADARRGFEPIRVTKIVSHHAPDSIMYMYFESVSCVRISIWLYTTKITNCLAQSLSPLDHAQNWSLTCGKDCTTNVYSLGEPHCDAVTLSNSNLMCITQCIPL